VGSPNSWHGCKTVRVKLPKQNVTEVRKITQVKGSGAKKRNGIGSVPGFIPLGRLFEACQAIAMEHEHLLGGLSVLPDHLHVCLRGAVADSPEAIAIGYMNESCRKLAVAGLWRPSYYVGTTGAYSMNAVRR